MELHDLEAERDYLGWVILDNAVIEQHPLDADELVGRGHAEILECMQSIRLRGEVVDTVSLRRELEAFGRLGKAGGDRALLELTARVGAQPVSTQPRIRELASLRSIREKLIRALHECDQRRLQPALELVNEVSDRARLARQCEILSAGAIVEHAVKTYGALEDRPAGEGSLLKASGIRNFDHLLGGLGPEDWMTIGADTNVGKSWVALTIGLQRWEKGERTGIISLEDPKLRWGTRLGAALSGISASAIKRRKLEPSDFPKVGDAIIRARAIGIELAFVLDGNIHRVIDTARSLVLDKGCTQIVLDYTQNLEGIESHSTHDQFSRMFTMLRRMLERLQAALVALSQVKRGEAKKRSGPRKSDLKEGGNIEQKSDYVVMLRRDPKRKNVVLAQLDKSKDGGNGLAWEYEQQRSGLLVESDPVDSAEFADGTPIGQPPADVGVTERVLAEIEAKKKTKPVQQPLPGAAIK